jgi:transposase
MSRDKRTRAYVERRTKEGKSKKEIIRCLKRYIAREVYRILASLSLNEPPVSVP